MGGQCCKNPDSHDAPDALLGKIKADANVAALAEADKLSTNVPVTPPTTTAPPVVTAPEEVPEQEEGDTTGETWTRTIKVSRADKQERWGLVWCENLHEPGMLRVKHFKPGETFAKYNASVTGEAKLYPGDWITTVNGVGMKAPAENLEAAGKLAFEQMRVELQSSLSVECTVLKAHRTVKVVLERASDRQFGIDLDDNATVKKVYVDAAVDDHNQAARQKKQFGLVVHPGMLVKSVNGVSDAAQMRTLLKSTSSKLTLVLDRQAEA